MAVDINGALTGGQKVVGKDALDLYAAGRDVWGKEDQFRFVCTKTTDDFTMTATVDDLTNTHPYAKAGLMVRQSLDKDASFAGVDVLPDGSLEFGARTAKGQDVETATLLGPELPNIQLRVILQSPT